MADTNPRPDAPPAQTPVSVKGHIEERPSKGKPIPGDQTDDEAKIEEFGERGLGVAAKE
jgi:hypothetical protein